MKRLAQFALLSVFNVACGATDGAEESVDADSAPITGGRLMESEDHHAPDTSAIKFQYTDSFGGIHICSGIKVGTNTYWTAGHCLESARNGTTVNITNNRQGTYVAPAGYIRAFASISIHPSRINYGLSASLGVFPDHYDVAIFTLNDTTPNIPAYSTTDATWVGPNQQVSYTGYGCDDLDPTHSGRKQYEFFNLADNAAIQAEGREPSYYVHNMSDVRDTPQGCDGDSGSPVFKLISGAWRIVGTTIHGGLGWTGFSRYGNVRNWFASPQFNQFSAGFQGFLLNQYTGRCILAGSSGTAQDWNCDGRAQDTDWQSWILRASAQSGVFFLRNGNTLRCLDLETTASGAPLVPRTCLPTSQTTNNTQLWRFQAFSGSGKEMYRQLVNVQTGRCAVPGDLGSAFQGVNGGNVVTTTCTSTAPTWRQQAWIMTR